MDKLAKEVIVKFLNEKNPAGKDVIEIVPRNWLHFEKDNWFCSYPPKEDEKFVDKWAKEGKIPQKGWKVFEVKILKDAGKPFSQVI